MKASIELAFQDKGLSAREVRLADKERQVAQSDGKGHGRRERRRLVSTTGLEGYIDWPGCRQVFQITRSRTIGEETQREVSYGITSLSREKADAARLLALTRGHWGIENEVFYVRDVTFGEDQCRVRSDSAPMILSVLRNVAIAVLGLAGVQNKAAMLRRHAAHPDEALALITANG